MEKRVAKPFPIEKEYIKNPDISPEDIVKLRTWLDTQQHLPRELITNLDLLIAYHCCEKSMEVAKQVIDLHFTVRTLFTQFFKDRCYDSKVAFNLDTVLLAPLPIPSVAGYKVVYLRLLDADPKNFNLGEAARTFMMLFDLWQYQEGTWPGLEIIIDFDQAVLSHVTRLEVMTVKKVMYFVQECLFAKLKALHFMNAPHFVDKVMLLLKPFLKRELMEVIKIHPVSTDTIYDCVPKKAFPRNEGGDYLDHNDIKEEGRRILQANQQYFSMENRRRVNEKLRAGGTSAAYDEFGLQGSFKKLDID